MGSLSFQWIDSFSANGAFEGAFPKVGGTGPQLKSVLVSKKSRSEEEYTEQTYKYLILEKGITIPPHIEHLRVGHRVPGRGDILLGFWAPRDRRAIPLNKYYAVFVALKNITGSFGRVTLWTYKEAAAHVSGLKKWCGHDGYDFQNDIKLYRDLKRGVYDGGWIFPPKQLMNGANFFGKIVWDQNLYRSKNLGDLKGTVRVTDTIRNNSKLPDFRLYWTCSSTKALSEFAIAVNMSNGTEIAIGKDRRLLNCRPFRLEELGL